MPLTTIFIIRHAFRGTWDTNPRTGEVSSRFPSPTGLPADPALTAYGERQAQELGELSSRLSPNVARIYSSPYYRCLQTIAPFAKRRPDIHIVIDRGISEWFGEAPWEQPKPAPLQDLADVLPDLDIRQYPGLNADEMEMLKEYEAQLRLLEQANRRRIKKAEHKRINSTSKKNSVADAALKQYQQELESPETQNQQSRSDHELDKISGDDSDSSDAVLGSINPTSDSIIPSSHGESITGLHDRVAFALDRIIDTNDQVLAKDPEPRSIVVVSHAAPIIAMGRTLTGRMPEDVCEEDFCTYTAGVSRFDRRQGWEQRLEQNAKLLAWREGDPVPSVAWRNGSGVRGGWECTVNSGTEHLSGGGNRDW